MLCGRNNSSTRSANQVDIHMCFFHAFPSLPISILSKRIFLHHHLTASTTFASTRKLELRQLLKQRRHRHVISSKTCDFGEAHMYVLVHQRFGHMKETKPHEPFNSNHSVYIQFHKVSCWTPGDSMPCTYVGLRDSMHLASLLGSMPAIAHGGGIR